MAKSLYITVSQSRSGKSAIVMGVMQALLGNNSKVGFFRPIIDPTGPDGKDQEIDRVLSHFGLGLDDAQTWALTMDDAKRLTNEGKQSQMMEIILTRYKQLEAQCQFVLCEGTDFPAGSEAFEADLNATIAANLGSPVLFIANAAGQSVDGVVSQTQLTMDNLRDKGVDLIGAIVNRAQPESADMILSALHTGFGATRYPGGLFSVIPEIEGLAAPTAAIKAVEAHVDTQKLLDKLTGHKTVSITPKMFEYGLIEKAQRHKQHIVLPEGVGERILKAADILLRRQVCDLTVLGDEQAVRGKIAKLGLDLNGLTIVDPKLSPMLDDYAETFCEMRKKKGISLEAARKAMTDETFFSTMMVHKGHADGMVSGSIHTTADTIVPAFQIIKTRPEASIVSSVFLMCLKDRVLVFGDCAVNPNPTAAQLAEIAVVSAETARIFGVEPRVAMLSYSTGTSAKGPDVDLVIEATALAREKNPDLLLEGPLQYDAAIAPEVAATKLPDSQVAGKATVFIFPNLSAGNNAYKAVQRTSSQVVAIGPVLQGLNKPVNDLSRGCTVPDIVNTVAITAIQAQAGKGLI